MTTRIKADSFSGASKLHDGTLSAAIRALAIDNAKRTLATAAVAALTDNGTGAAADGTVGSIPIPAAFTEVGTASNPKAGFETALATVKDAITELAAKLVALKAVVPASDIVDNSGGTAADGTIAAMTKTVTAVNTAIAAYAGTKTVCEAIRNAFYVLVLETNKFRVAAGLTPITNNISGAGITTYSATIAAIAVSTGTAVDGTALSGTSKADADLFLTACADATKELSTAINAVRAVTAPAVTTVAAA